MAVQAVGTRRSAVNAISKVFGVLVIVLCESYSLWQAYLAHASNATAFTIFGVAFVVGAWIVSR